jgi:hypothetical protein
MLNITNNTPQMVTLTKEGDHKFVADYGTKQKGFQSKFNISLVFDSDASAVSIQSGCTCRVKSKLNKIDGKNFTADIEWVKNKDAGQIQKDIHIMYTENGERHKTTLRLTGKISDK